MIESPDESHDPSRDKSHDEDAPAGLKSFRQEKRRRKRKRKTKENVQLKRSLSRVLMNRLAVNGVWQSMYFLDQTISYRTGFMGDCQIYSGQCTHTHTHTGMVRNPRSGDGSQNLCQTITLSFSFNFFSVKFLCEITKG